jgi:hypothetical protein
MAINIPRFAENVMRPPWKTSEGKSENNAFFPYICLSRFPLKVKCVCRSVSITEGQPCFGSEQPGEAPLFSRMPGCCRNAVQGALRESSTSKAVFPADCLWKIIYYLKKRKGSMACAAAERRVPAGRFSGDSGWPAAGNGF